MLHKVVDAGPNETHIRRHALASRPDGPAAPSVAKAAWRIKLPVSDVRNKLDAPLGVNPAEALKEHVAGAQC